MTSAGKSWIIAVALALALVGCGVRGSLETPPETKAATTADADSGQGKAPEDAPKAHKGFILDGLIR